MATPVEDTIYWGRLFSLLVRASVHPFIFSFAIHFFYFWNINIIGLGSIKRRPVKSKNDCWLKSGRICFVDIFIMLILMYCLTVAMGVTYTYATHSHIHTHPAISTYSLSLSLWLRPELEPASIFQYVSVCVYIIICIQRGLSGRMRRTEWLRCQRCWWRDGVGQRNGGFDEQSSFSI